MNPLLEFTGGGERNCVCLNTVTHGYGNMLNVPGLADLLGPANHPTINPEVKNGPLAFSHSKLLTPIMADLQMFQPGSAMTVHPDQTKVWGR